MEKTKRFRTFILTVALAIVGGLFLVEGQAMARTPVVKCKSDSECGVGWYCHRYKDCSDEDSGSCRLDMEFWKTAVGSEKARADTAERERDQSKAELAKAGTELDRLRAELEKAKTNPTYKQELDLLQEKYNRLKSKYAKLKKKYHRDMAAKDSEIEGLLAEIAELRGELAELRAENTLVKEENRELKLELKKQPFEIFTELSIVMNAKGQKKQIKVCGSECTLQWTREYSAPLYGLLGFGYQFLLPKDLEVVGLRLGLFAKFGRGARFDVYGGAGLEFQIGIFPEPKRILGIIVDARVSYERAEDHEWAWNYGFGLGLGADMRTFGIYGLVRFERYGFPEEINCVVFSVQFSGRVPGTRPK